jgi:hypothetical protein
MAVRRRSRTGRSDPSRHRLGALDLICRPARNQAERNTALGSLPRNQERLVLPPASDSRSAERRGPNSTAYGTAFRRHTGPAWMADAGVPVHALRKIAGHDWLNTTQRYLHPDRQSIADAGLALSAHLGAS